MLGMEFIDNFIDICDQLRSCSSIEEVETLKRILKHSICDKDISTGKSKLKEVIGSSVEGGGEEFQISGNNRKLGKSRIPSVDELTKQVDCLIGEVNKLAAPPLQTGSMNNENEFDFESRRSIFYEIMEAIKDDGVGMIGIWGMPGIGKTTLVKRVAKYARDEGLFKEVAMVVVSHNPSVKAIQGQIADKIGLKLTSESEEGRADQLLKRLLAGKKIMVILDDIWDFIELNDIGIPSRSQHKGCKIILTSRNRGVCEEMRTGKNFTIDLLSENEALNLFLQMSGVDDRCSEKGRLAMKLSEECGRLPISIAIVARGLLNKEQLYWTDMLNRLRKSDPVRKVHTTIQLSYDNLYREEEKIFFLLCALFPEDYKIPVQVLFEYGLGLNLFERVDNVDEAIVRAQNLASRLKSSSLLLDEGDEKFVKMHDVIRDIALAIASEGKHVFLVPGKTAISLWFNDNKKLLDALECPQLQILMLHQDLQLHDNFFAGMENLIVLDMSHKRFVRLPQFFAALENLRTLRLSECILGDISTIGKLQNLVSLTFYDSNIEVLPKEVGELSNLRLLEFSNCRNLKLITPGVIQNLSQLEVLRVGSNVRWCDEKEVWRPENASLLELIHLSRLMILEISIPNASMLPNQVLFEKLTKFKVSIGKVDFQEMNIFSSNSQILKLKRLSENELLKAGIKMLMKKAQHLKLNGISRISVALPCHLGGYESLKELIVKHCTDVNYVLDMTKSEYEPAIPSLQLLHLIDLPLLKEIGKGEFPSLFVSKLEHLQLLELPRLVHLWPFQAESNLTTMIVESCHKLEYLFDLISAKSLLKLKELEVGKCRNLQAICLSKEQDDEIVSPQVIFHALETLHINNLEKLEKIWHIQTRVELFFQLKVLELTRCQNLFVVFPPQATLGLQNLEGIWIENCDKLETLFQLDDVALTVGDEMVLFPRLLALKLVNLPKLTTIFPSNVHAGLQNLEELYVQSCSSLEHVFAGEDHPPLLSNLQEIELYNLSELKQLWWNKNTRESFGLPSLHSLAIHNCPTLQFIFDPSVDNCLENLRTLVVGNCPSMVEIVAEKPGKKIEFPLLESLRLVNLPRFKVNQDVEFPQAEYVFVDYCFNNKESCSVDVKNEPAGSVRFFESFVERSKTGMFDVTWPDILD